MNKEPNLTLTSQIKLHLFHLIKQESSLAFIKHGFHSAFLLSFILILLKDLRMSQIRLVCQSDLWVISWILCLCSSNALKVKAARSLTNSDISRLRNSFQMSLIELELPTNLFLLTETEQLSPNSLYAINSSSLAYCRNVSLEGNSGGRLQNITV